MRPTLTLALAALLAACGVDGEPERPTQTQTQTAPGVSITGRAEVGVAKSW